jgi:hypothetical protein
VVGQSRLVPRHVNSFSLFPKLAENPLQWREGWISQHGVGEQANGGDNG